MNAAGCYHCGEPLPTAPLRLEIAGEPRQLCCAGCAAAAQWIRDAGLGDYYRLRQSDAPRADTDIDDYRAWDRSDVQAGHVRMRDDGCEITVVVEGMRCAACAWLIDRALQRSPGVHEVGANAVTGRVRLAWDPTRTALSPLLQRLAGLGYRPHLAGGEAAERARRHERNLLIARLGVALLGSMQAMMFAEALYLDTAREMAPATRDFFRWITFLVSTPVVFYSGWPFLTGCWQELKARSPGMDSLIASSVLLAYFASLFETLRGGAHVWFDAAVMFVLFLLAARFLERMARQQASAQLDTLARAQPALAWREVDDQREQVPVAELRVGDIVQVPPGDVVPADGELLDSAAAIDESLLSGEARPVLKAPGAELYAGSFSRESSARLRVLRTGSDTRLSQLTRIVEQAQAQRPRLARWADRVANRFVSLLFVAAVLVYLYWWQQDPARAFEIALAVLVVSCPCALSLAVPTALASASSALARMGVLLLGHDALERLSRVDTVVFDKTGTLTVGKPEIAGVHGFGIDAERAIALAAMLEHGSRHPLAAAFPRASRHAESTRVLPGRGIEGRVDGRRLCLGRADFAAGRDDDGELWLGDGEHALARFRVSDPLRVDAPAALSGLRELGLQLRLLSGDGDAAVSALGDQLGIADRASRQSPEDKLQAVRLLQAQGRRVLMVGDGINDAPVLAAADVSIAMADGAPLAQRSADAVLTGSSLMRLPQALLLARRTQRVIRQNLAWALAYNLIALPFAAMGLVTPGLAALGMAGSSLLVTVNALRLMRGGRQGANG
ncbi:MAG TPA: heavy metal translocating P-type ATPase, partial [Arenimonas sp.]|nr:heavy metal translocating P-type ATPase [Arenimonas sp.]